MEVIDPSTIIGECLETAWHLPQYVKIITAVKENGFKASDKFRKDFNAYYRVRQRKPEWYEKYYTLMETQKRERLSFEQLLRELLPFGNIEVSFASKLLATVDVDCPIWDQYVLKNFGLYKDWTLYARKEAEERIRKAAGIYSSINDWYREFLGSAAGRECVDRFNSVLPAYAGIISDVKKVDFMLVSKRQA